MDVLRRTEPLAAAAVAALLAAVLVWAGPPGADLAAHVYQRALYLQHGFILWNNFWYAGRYSFVVYSISYYPLAALLGIKLLAVLTVAASVIAFAAVVRHEWGPQSTWAIRVFAIVWALVVMSAAFPFMLGSAFALAALSALQRQRRLMFPLCAVGAFAASPLAFLLLVVVLAGVLVARRDHGVRLVAPSVATAAVVAIGVLLQRLFPTRGSFPFSLAEFAAVVAFCTLGLALTYRVGRAGLLCCFFAAYLVACSVAFAVSSPIGENIARVRFVAAPLAVLTMSLRSWRPRALCIGVLALAVSWNLTPLEASFARGVDDRAAHASYWAPAIRYVRHHLTPAFRVEAVDTTGHWPADFLARAGIPLTRGWFRQADFPENRVLYGDLGRRAYLRWLRTMSVRYVVLTDAAPDYSARAEAALLRSGRAGLTLVFRSNGVEIFAVPSPRPLVAKPARVLALRYTSIELRVPHPGTYALAVTYSPYWQTQGGCVQRAANGMTRLVVRRRGVIALKFSLTPARALAALDGADAVCS